MCKLADPLEPTRRSARGSFHIWDSCRPSPMQLPGTWSIRTLPGQDRPHLAATRPPRPTTRRHDNTSALVAAAPRDGQETAGGSLDCRSKKFFHHDPPLSRCFRRSPFRKWGLLTYRRVRLIPDSNMPRLSAPCAEDLFFRSSKPSRPAFIADARSVAVSSRVTIEFESL